MERAFSARFWGNFFWSNIFESYQWVHITLLLFDLQYVDLLLNTKQRTVGRQSCRGAGWRGAGAGVVSVIIQRIPWIPLVRQIKCGRQTRAREWHGGVVDGQQWKVNCTDHNPISNSVERYHKDKHHPPSSPPCFPRNSFPSLCCHFQWFPFTHFPCPSGHRRPRHWHRHSTPVLIWKIWRAAHHPSTMDLILCDWVRWDRRPP